MKSPLARNLKPNLRKIAQPEPLYYLSGLINSLQSENRNDYFVQLYKEHFNQSFQALQYCRGLVKPHVSQFKAKPVFLKKRESHKSMKNIKYFFCLNENNFKKIIL